MERVTELSQERMILVGANDPLPDDHFWFDGEGFSVYAAKQPRSTWHEHVHDCVQVTVGLEPAHMHAEWRANGKAPPKQGIYRKRSHRDPCSRSAQDTGSGEQR